MHCRHVRKAIHEALNEKAKLAPEAEAHLTACAKCRAEYAALRQLSGLLAVAVDTAATSPAPARGAVSQHSGAPAGVIRALPVLRHAWGMHLGWAAVAAVAFLAGFALRPVTEPKERIVEVRVPIAAPTPAEAAPVTPAPGAEPQKPRPAPAPVVTTAPSAPERPLRAAPSRVVVVRRGEESATLAGEVPQALAPPPVETRAVAEQVPPPLPSGTVTYTEAVVLAKLADDQTGG
jgi:hypothetical protein